MKKSTMAGIGAAAVLAMAAFAAGCGGSSDSAGGSSTDTTTTTTPDHDGRHGAVRAAVGRRLHRPGARLLLRLVEHRVRDVREAPQLPRHGRHRRRDAPARGRGEPCRPLSNGDKTYTFTVRDGFKFSPPSDAPVTAMTFKKVIERDLSKAMNSPAQSFAGDILGAKEFTAGTAKEVEWRQGRRQQDLDHARQAGRRLPLPHRDAVLLRRAGEHADQRQRRSRAGRAQARTTSSPARRTGRSSSPRTRTTAATARPASTA